MKNEGQQFIQIDFYYLFCLGFVLVLIYSYLEVSALILGN